MEGGDRGQRWQGTGVRRERGRAGARMAGGKCSRGRGWLSEDLPGTRERRAVLLAGEKVRETRQGVLS